MDLIAANICVLDETGQIILTNTSWENFAKAHGISESSEVGAGTDYPEFCSVANGGIYVSQKFAKKMVNGLKNYSDKAPHENLSLGEFKIFCMTSAGNTLTEIAGVLNLRVGTVRTYRSRILAKTTLKNNAQITNYAFKNKLIQ